MKMTGLFRTFLFLTILAVPAFVKADIPDNNESNQLVYEESHTEAPVEGLSDPGDNPDAPIDSWQWVLLLGGAVYGIWKFRHSTPASRAPKLAV